jgi:Planctomycete extracellular
MPRCGRKGERAVLPWCQRRTPRQKERAGRRLAVEPLEDRCLLAAIAPAGVGPLPTVLLGLTPAQRQSADVVIDWNATLLRAIWDSGTPPTIASRDLAMVGVAVFDAVDAIDHVYRLYAVPGLHSPARPPAPPPRRRRSPRLTLSSAT